MFGCCGAWVFSSRLPSLCLCSAHLRYTLPLNGRLIFLPHHHVRPRPCKVSRCLRRLHGRCRLHLAPVRRSHTLLVRASLVLSNGSPRTPGERVLVVLSVLCLQSQGPFSAVEHFPGFPPFHLDPPGKALFTGWQRRRRGPLSQALTIAPHD